MKTQNTSRYLYKHIVQHMQLSGMFINTPRLEGGFVGFWQTSNVGLYFGTWRWGCRRSQSALEVTPRIGNAYRHTALNLLQASCFSCFDTFGLVRFWRWDSKGSDDAQAVSALANATRWIEVGALLKA
jgi:hypothetical protein